MNDNTAQTLIIVALIAGVVALVVTGHGGWIVAVLLLFLIFAGG